MPSLRATLTKLAFRHSLLCFNAESGGSFMVKPPGVAKQPTDALFFREKHCTTRYTKFLE